MISPPSVSTGGRDLRSVGRSMPVGGGRVIRAEAAPAADADEAVSAAIFAAEVPVAVIILGLLFRNFELILPPPPANLCLPVAVVG